MVRVGDVAVKPKLVRERDWLLDVDQVHELIELGSDVDVGIEVAHDRDSLVAARGQHLVGSVGERPASLDVTEVHTPGPGASGPFPLPTICSCVTHGRIPSARLGVSPCARLVGLCLASPRAIAPGSNRAS